MRTKDFINIGVFSAIYVVLVWVFAMLGILGAAMMFVGYALGIIANGVVIALFKSRVPHLGALTILCTLTALVMTISGHALFVLVIAPVLGFLADLCYRQGGKAWRVIGYAVVSLWYITPWLPVFIDAQGYYDYVASEMNEEYAKSLEWFLSPAMIAAWGGMIFILGLIGGLFGESVMGRHFRKSGVAK